MELLYLFGNSSNTFNPFLFQSVCCWKRNINSAKVGTIEREHCMAGKCICRGCTNSARAMLILPLFPPTRVVFVFTNVITHLE